MSGHISFRARKVALLDKSFNVVCKIHLLTNVNFLFWRAWDAWMHETNSKMKKCMAKILHREPVEALILLETDSLSALTSSYRSLFSICIISASEYNIIWLRVDVRLGQCLLHQFIWVIVCKIAGLFQIFVSSFVMMGVSDRRTSRPFRLTNEFVESEPFQYLEI